MSNPEDRYTNLEEEVIDIETKTVVSLYTTNSTIRYLIDFWVDKRRCPMGLVDELLEEGLEDAADCALWASEKEDTYAFNISGLKCGPYPSYDPREFDPEKAYWYWMSGSYSGLGAADDVPLQNCKLQDKESKSAKDAIIWLLDNWRK